jgi:hypothetical protein
MHNVVMEVSRVKSLERTDGTGTIRKYFGYANAPEGVEADADGGIAISLLTPDATMRDSNGKPVTAASFVEFSDVVLNRDLDQEGAPSVTGQRKTPVYGMRLTPTSGATLQARGLSFDEAVDVPTTPSAPVADDGE